jgi:hypothetical protein
MALISRFNVPTGMDWRKTLICKGLYTFSMNLWINFGSTL